jgi:uncharacterized membrane protein YesL
MKSIFRINSPFVTFAEKLFDCMLLSVLWILFSLPVFTIGASSAALYNTANKYLRKNKGKLIKTFWSSFKENFKRSTLIWLISMAVMALLSIDVIVFRNLKIKGEPLVRFTGWHYFCSLRDLHGWLIFQHIRQILTEV